jgi:hypothetical protein
MKEEQKVQPKKKRRFPGAGKAARARREYELLCTVGNTDSMYLTPWLRFAK